MMMGWRVIGWRSRTYRRSRGPFRMWRGRLGLRRLPDRRGSVSRVAEPTAAGAAIVLLAACALALAGCSKKSEAEQPEAPAPVQVTSVTQENIERVVDADGVLFPLDQANIMPKISAPVAKFNVNRGDHVRAGQVLATLENRDLSAAVFESRGQLNQDRKSVV